MPNEYITAEIVILEWNMNDNSWKLVELILLPMYFSI